MEDVNLPFAKRRKLKEESNPSFANLPAELFLQLANEIGEGDPETLINFCSTDKRTRDLCVSYHSTVSLTPLFSERMSLLDYARYLRGDYDPVRDWLWAWWNRSHNTVLSSGIIDNKQPYEAWLQETEWHGQPLEQYYDLDSHMVERNKLLLFVNPPISVVYIPQETGFFEILRSKGVYWLPEVISYIAQDDLDAARTNSSVVGIPLGDDPEDREDYIRVVDLPLYQIAKLLYLPENVRYADPPSLIAKLLSMEDEERQEFGDKVRTLYLSSLYEQLPPYALSDLTAPTIFDMFNISLALGYDVDVGDTLYLFAKFSNDPKFMHPRQTNYWSIE